MINSQSASSTNDLSPQGFQESPAKTQAELNRAEISAKEPAPIILFAYNRPRHTLQALESLAANPLANVSTLYIFCDGPKRWGDKAGVAAVRQVVRQRHWCRTVHIEERAANAGLANSVIGGVTQIIKRHGRAIVIEDDLIVSARFLNFMNAALAAYQETPEVMQVSGYMYPISMPDKPSPVFLPIISSWGWATWQRAWDNFDPKMTGADAILNDPAMRHRFDLDGSHPWSLLIDLQRKGRMDSWAIRWYISVFRANGLVLYPAQSLVQNSGFDGTGTHCTQMSDYQVTLAESPCEQFPSTTVVDSRTYARLVDFHRKLIIPKPPLLDRIRRRLRYLLSRKSA